MESSKVICGKCKYHDRSGSEWYCDNEDSEYYGCETNYDDSCEDGEEVTYDEG